RRRVLMDRLLLPPAPDGPAPARAPPRRRSGEDGEVVRPVRAAPEADGFLGRAQAALRRDAFVAVEVHVGYAHARRRAPVAADAREEAAEAIVRVRPKRRLRLAEGERGAPRERIAVLVVERAGEVGVPAAGAEGEGTGAPPRLGHAAGHLHLGARAVGAARAREQLDDTAVAPAAVKQRRRTGPDPEAAEQAHGHLPEV